MRLPRSRLQPFGLEQGLPSWLLDGHLPAILKCQGRKLGQASSSLLIRTLIIQGQSPTPITSFALNYLHHGPICKYSLTVLRGWLRARHVQSIRDPHGRLQRAAHLSLPQPQTRAFPQDLLSLPLTMKRPAKKSPKMFFIKPQCACKSSRCFVNKVILQGSRLEVAGSHRGRQACRTG